MQARTYQCIQQREVLRFYHENTHINSKMLSMSLNPNDKWSILVRQCQYWYGLELECFLCTIWIPARANACGHICWMAITSNTTVLFMFHWSLKHINWSLGSFSSICRLKHAISGSRVSKSCCRWYRALEELLRSEWERHKCTHHVMVTATFARTNCLTVFSGVYEIVAAHVKLFVTHRTTIHLHLSRESIPYSRTILCKLGQLVAYDSVRLEDFSSFNHFWSKIDELFPTSTIYCDYYYSHRRLHYSSSNISQ